MKNVELDNSDLKHFFHLLPIIGFFPSLWTLYRHGNQRKGDRTQLAISRLSVTLTGSWLLGYVLLGIGAETSETFLSLRFLVLNSFLTSGYFLVSIWLMVRLSSRKSVRLSGFSHLADQLFSKHS